jgi:hypothetical protein
MGMAAAVLALASLARAAVELTPFRVEESRSATLAPDKMGQPADHLTVVLSLKGPEADSSVRYGDLKVQEAVDDKGASLIPAKDAMGRDAGKFKDYSNAFFRKFDLESKRPAATPQIELTLAPAARSATRIVRLRGSFSLAQQGTIKTVELTALKSTGNNKKLDVPAEAGLTITLTIKSDKDDNSIGLQMTGDENALESIEVLDAAGEKVSSGMSSWSFGGGPEQKSIDLRKPLDDSMKLVAKVAVDRKIVVVPFDLKDIALP